MRGRRLTGLAAAALLAVCLGGCAQETGRQPEAAAPSEQSPAGSGQPLSVWNRAFPQETELPAAYDCRDAGRAPQIGNQGSLGTCWAFASLTALSSSLLPQENLTFSVDHMTLHNGFNLSQEEGGEYTMALAYLLSWQGPVLEAQDPYGDGVSPEGLTAVRHVQEVRIPPPKDYEAIKRAVYLAGGVQSSLYTAMESGDEDSEYYNRETNSYCYSGEREPNHDSVIVGWDDAYPRENFARPPEGDGAFLCTNSWGEAFGEDGFFYVSYYDTNIGVNNLVYTGVEAADNYDVIHQSDRCGWIGQIGYGEDTAWFANAYRAQAGEVLEAAGFYATAPGTEYEIRVARHLPQESGQATAQELSRMIGEENVSVCGRLEDGGFYTVPLGQKIVLDEGEKFAIIVKIKTPGTVHPAAIEYDAGDGLAQVDLSDGEGYLSYDGGLWEQVETAQSCNLCLKAYGSVRERPDGG